jgi:hypothetical protein
MASISEWRAKLSQGQPPAGSILVDCLSVSVSRVDGAAHSVEEKTIILDPLREKSAEPIEAKICALHELIKRSRDKPCFFHIVPAVASRHTGEVGL